SSAALERASQRLHLDRLPARQAGRVNLLLGSLTYRDKRLAGHDAAAVVEVVEHIDPPRLTAFETALFGHARPGVVVLTTPNAEYNARFVNLSPEKLRHPDHRFEWTRAEFQDWCARVCEHHGYNVSFGSIGPDDPELGSPTQMAVFAL